MNKRILHENKWHLLIYGVIAVFYFWMAAQIPYTHDDWDWGLDIGMHQLIHATVNSRYSGNLFEVLMTRSELAKTIIMGAGYFLIPFSLSRIASRFFAHSSESVMLKLFLICNCLLLTMDREMWRQTYGWAAGNANFVVSAMFMLPWITELLRCCDAAITPKKDSWFILLLFFLLSFASQLFLENLAIYHVFTGVLICGIHFYRKRKIPAKNQLMLCGAILGLFIMFSSSLYETLFSTGTAVGNYREIPLISNTGILAAIRQTAITAIHLSNRLYTRNFTLVLFLTAALAITLLRSNLEQKKKSAFTTGNILLCILLLISFLYDITANYHQTYMFVFDAVLSMVFFGVVLSEIYVLFHNDKAVMIKLLLLWFAPVIIIAPLILTTEVGSRLFFSSNVVLILFGLILANNIFSHHAFPRCNTAVTLLAAITCVLVLYHGYIYLHIGECKREREGIIQKAATSEVVEIVLPPYPFSEYLHFPNPSADYRVDFFKEFYGIPMNVDIVFEE